MTTDPKRWRILQIINIGTFMSTLDVGIVNVSLPAMSGQFGVSLAQIQWVATAYLLTMVALLPFLGKLSDIGDRRKIYSLGFLVFGVGSLGTAFSQGIAAILVFRCLQGVGATMIMSNSQAMVRQVFPDHERGRALGFNAIVISAGTLSGPALGGLLLEFVSWPWLFLINVPFALVAFVLGLRWFPRTHGGGTRSAFDIAGSVLLAAATSLLMLAAEASRGSGRLTPANAGEAALGLALFAALWLYERRIAFGILDRELFSRRNVLLGNASAFLIHLSQMATTIPITFYLQGPLGFSVSVTGVLLILQPLLMGLVAPFAGWFRDRYGGFFPITAGPLFCAVSMLFVACTGTVTALGIGLQLAVFGIGIGLFQAANNAEIMSAAPEGKISLAGSLLALIRYLGMIAGIGLATLLVGSMGLDGADAAQISLPMRLLFGLCFLCCLAVAAIGRLRPRDKPRRTAAPESPRRTAGR